MRRKLWAEEIALAMEAQGKYGMMKIVAAHLGVNYQSLMSALRNARRDGFDAYPPRQRRL